MFEKEKIKKGWLTERKKYTVANLLKELETEPQDLHNNELFQNLLTLIRPKIEKKNTFMRDAVAVAAPLLPGSAPGACYHNLVAQPTATAT
jgi:hypothetical protein